MFLSSQFLFLDKNKQINRITYGWAKESSSFHNWMGENDVHVKQSEKLIREYYRLSSRAQCNVCLTNWKEKNRVKKNLTAFPLVKCDLPSICMLFEWTKQHCVPCSYLQFRNLCFEPTFLPLCFKYVYLWADDACAFLRLTKSGLVQFRSQLLWTITIQWMICFYNYYQFDPFVFQ